MWGIPQRVWDRLLKWAIFGVLIALAPLVFNYVGALILEFDPTFVSVLANGELFLVSAGISAASIGELFGGGEARKGYKYVAGGGSVVVVLFASLFFALVSVAHRANMDVGEGIIAVVSVILFVCGIAASGGCVALAEDE